MIDCGSDVGPLVRDGVESGGAEQRGCDAGLFRSVEEVFEVAECHLHVDRVSGLVKRFDALDEESLGLLEVAVDRFEHGSGASDERCQDRQLVVLGERESSAEDVECPGRVGRLHRPRCA